MQTVPILHSIREEFARSAAWRRERERRFVENSRRREEEDRKRGRDHEDRHDALLDVAVAALATNVELDRASLEMDIYKTATVDALMENEEQLKLVREQKRILLDQAYVLPDGRRVFKTEDGTQVFDEFGKEVDASIIEPDQIEDWRPFWEKYQSPFKAEQALDEERGELLEFQDLVDEMDAEIEEARQNGGMSRERLEEITMERNAAAPDAVKRRVDPNYVVSAVQNKNTEDIEHAAGQTPAVKLNMPAL
ncbi:MAG: hypothetical protein WDZ83_14425 [Rhizobiaceae bacterium]